MLFGIFAKFSDIRHIMNKIKQLFSRDDLRFWLPFVVAVKLILFTYFAFEFYHYRDPKAMVNGLAATTGDTPGYYNPAQAVADGLGYNSSCRMPAFVPIYSPLSMMLGEQNAKSAMVFIQLVFSILSVIALGRWAQRIIQRPYIFQWTVVLYALSSFVSIWDHYLMSDSFSTSFFIFSLYFLERYFTKRNISLLLLSGALLAWCVFFRQIFLVIYPAIAFILFIKEEKRILPFVKSGLVFILPLVISLFSWAQYNKAKRGEFIVLVSPLEECFGTYSKEYQAVAGYLIDMGYGEPFWEDGSLPQWMLRNKKNTPMPPIPDRHFTSVCNADSLEKLKNDYQLYLALPAAERDSIGELILSKAQLYKEVYKKEKWFNYYVLNRLRHVRVFLLPLQVDNLPGPSYPEMNPIEKAVKLFYLTFFTLITVAGFIAMLLLMKKNIALLAWFTPALSIFIALTVVLGYVEQRYIVPLYPMFLVATAAMFASLFRGRNSDDGITQ